MFITFKGLNSNNFKHSPHFYIFTRITNEFEIIWKGIEISTNFNSMNSFQISEKTGFYLMNYNNNGIFSITVFENDHKRKLPPSVSSTNF